MGRIRFLEKNGQRNFLDLCILRLNSPSLRGLLQFGFDVPYSTLKNYYSCIRLLPEELFDDLCDVARLDKFQLDYDVLSDNWGRVVGGKTSKRGKLR